jgi:hypothetical protein
MLRFRVFVYLRISYQLGLHPTLCFLSAVQQRTKVCFPSPFRRFGSRQRALVSRLHSTLHRSAEQPDECLGNRVSQLVINTDSTRTATPPPGGSTLLTLIIGWQKPHRRGQPARARSLTDKCSWHLSLSHN